MARLPMRFRILHLMSKNEKMDVNDIMSALRDEYGKDGQFKLSTVNTHLASMRAVGLIEVCDVRIDPKDNLIQTYRITDYGRSRLSYLPAAWK